MCVGVYRVPVGLHTENTSRSLSASLTPEADTATSKADLISGTTTLQALSVYQIVVNLTGGWDRREGGMNKRTH